MDEELLARQTPQALEAEQSVLGSMLIDERCVPDVVGMLQPEDFYLRQNREIYETIYTMFNSSEKTDPVTVPAAEDHADRRQRQAILHDRA